MKKKTNDLLYAIVSAGCLNHKANQSSSLGQAANRLIDSSVRDRLIELGAALMPISPTADHMSECQRHEIIIIIKYKSKMCGGNGGQIFMDVYAANILEQGRH